MRRARRAVLANVPGFFADVHYEFYFSQGADTPVIPVRVGLILP